MLMSPNKDETAVHGCHCQGDMAVRMRKVLQTAGLVFECVTSFFRVSLLTLLVKLNCFIFDFFVQDQSKYISL